MSPRSCACVVLLLALSCLTVAWAVPPEGNGLAASYPGDVGIENDPSVVWVEQFEEPTIAELCSRYNDVMGQSAMSFSTDKPAGSPGSTSWCITHTNPDPGAHLFKTFPTGYDQLYVRFYVKFGAASEMPHHFVWLGGQNPPLSYPDPHAGQLPSGSDRFSAGFEPNGCSCPEGYKWRWEFYNYWMGMKQSPDNKYWGNILMWMPTSNPDWPVPKEEWICVEGMIKLNSPATSANGENGLWINGSLLRRSDQIISYLLQGAPNGSWTHAMFTPDPASPGFEGFQWRNTTALKLTYLWLEDYLDGAIIPGADVWIDHVVVATQYVGPMVTASLPPVANFSANPASGTAPLTVFFTDTSTNGPTSWSWSFGDTGTSTSRNPSHQYTSAGTYTVSLTATNAYGSDDEIKTNYISVSQGIFSDNFDAAFSGWTLTRTPDWFTGTPKNGTHSIQFRGTSSAGEDEAIQRTVSTVGRTGIRVSFSMGGKSLDNANEYIAASWYDGSAWTELKRIRGGDAENDGQLHPYSYALPSGADNNPSFRIKFALVASASNDYGYVDDVAVTSQ